VETIYQNENKLVLQVFKDLILIQIKAFSFVCNASIWGKRLQVMGLNIIGSLHHFQGNFDQGNPYEKIHRFFGLTIHFK